ncbi:hypothetical protein DFH29DRAFT_878340 [Suillus ampliporus]|nr:hypothetical protein DFH29DRAFT_878340 [Suillus ampliporus]
MTDFSGMFHEDISGPDDPELWMANTSFASYPPDLPAGYSTMYDADGLVYPAGFSSMSPSIGSSSASSPSSEGFELQPSAHGQEHLYEDDASSHQWFSNGRLEGGPFDGLGIMHADQQFLMEQPLRTVHMSDVIVPTMMPQHHSDHLHSLHSPPTVRATNSQFQWNHSTEEESDAESEGDSYCPSDASGSPVLDRHSAGPASSLFPAPPPRRRRRQDIHLPVPVPNLTKKSRGRKVPVSSGEPVYARSKDKSKKGTRTYTCHVDGCGKCFVRSEHLKRHIRSITRTTNRGCARLAGAKGSLAAVTISTSICAFTRILKMVVSSPSVRMYDSAKRVLADAI